MSEIDKVALQAAADWLVEANIRGKKMMIDYGVGQIIEAYEAAKQQTPVVSDDAEENAVKGLVTVDEHGEFFRIITMLQRRLQKTTNYLRRQGYSPRIVKAGDTVRCDSIERLEALLEQVHKREKAAKQQPPQIFHSDGTEGGEPEYTKPDQAIDCLEQQLSSIGDVYYQNDLLETLYWEFKEESKRGGEERWTFKGKMAYYARAVLEQQPPAAPGGDDVERAALAMINRRRSCVEKYTLQKAQTLACWDHTLGDAVAALSAIPNDTALVRQLVEALEWAQASVSGVGLPITEDKVDAALSAGQAYLQQQERKIA